MWIKSMNCEPDKPAEIVVEAGGVIVRRGFRFVEDHWEYEEWQMSAEQYDVYQAMQTETADLSDALIELAEIVAGGE